jgi:CHAT domain-containing protein
MGRVGAVEERPRTEAEFFEVEAAAARKAAWEPVEARLPPTAKTVVLCPDGGLGDLPFGALPGKKPGAALWEEVRLRWVACAQDLVPSRREGARGAGALLAGGVSYEPDPPVAAPPDAVGADAALRRAAAWLDQPPPMGPYEPLPASLAQAEALAPLWGDGAALLSGAEATEARVAQAAPGRRVLHFATVGAAPEALWLGLARAPYLEDLAFARQSGHGHDPGTLAGVVLAGAGAGRGGAGDDGVLSAAQAAMLDLGACEAVVLSAWPTAQGTPGTAQARAAMARGFLAAGARTVVANLWPVEEEAAGLLLARVHEAFARAETPPAGGEVLREAALWLRGHKSAAGRTYELPRHWAAWIAYERR